jgi:hypothetical protein
VIFVLCSSEFITTAVEELFVHNWTAQHGCFSMFLAFCVFLNIIIIIIIYVCMYVCMHACLNFMAVNLGRNFYHFWNKSLFMLGCIVKLSCHLCMRLQNNLFLYGFVTKHLYSPAC